MQPFNETKYTKRKCFQQYDAGCDAYFAAWIESNQSNPCRWRRVQQSHGRQSAQFEIRNDRGRFVSAAIATVAAAATDAVDGGGDDQIGRRVCRVDFRFDIAIPVRAGHGVRHPASGGAAIVFWSGSETWTTYGVDGDAARDRCHCQTTTGVASVLPQSVN